MSDNVNRVVEALYAAGCDRVSPRVHDTWHWSVSEEDGLVTVDDGQEQATATAEAFERYLSCVETRPEEDMDAWAAEIWDALASAELEREEATHAES